MKRIICALLVGAMLLMLCACGGKKGNSETASGSYADENTISIVNSAYEKTENTIKDISAIGFELKVTKTVKLGDNSEAQMFKKVYNSLGDGTYFYQSTEKADDIDKTLMIYNDNKNIYGYNAETTYLLSKNNNTDEYVGKLGSIISVYNASKLKVVDTVIIDASNDGHGFLLEYDFNDQGFDPEAVFGSDMYSEIKDNKDIKPVGLRVSGIINKDGQLTSQTLTYTYTYEYEEEVTDPTIDPDNSDASNLATKVEKKTATVELVAERSLNYSINKINVPSDITVLPDETQEGDGENEGDEDEDEEKITLKELSISDFLKLKSSDNDEK